MRPQLFIIAGPNAVGKTTFAREFLPSYARCDNFVNADLIAQGLAPFAPGTMLLKAGRLLLEQVHVLADQKQDFAFETTLAGRSYASLLARLRRRGYQVHLFFLWIPRVELALTRIASRVKMGGHDIPSDTVRRCFHRGLVNFLQGYRRLVDSWYLFDNSGTPPRLVAKEESGSCVVLNASLYADILNQGSAHG